MKHGSQALEARTGIDGGLRQRRHRAGGVAIELHENEIPDFDVAAAFATESAFGMTLARRCRAHVVVNFTARPAWTRIAHGPEIFLQPGNRNHAVARRSHAYPQRRGVGVGGKLYAGRGCSSAEHGEIKPVERYGEPFRGGDQLPGKGDGLFFEVIAKGKIAQHLEKGVVAIGEADIFEVVVLAPGAHAFLRGGGALVVALLEAEENVLELVHARIGKKKRGVAYGHKGGAAHHAMSVGGKKFQKSAADFVTCRHQWVLLVLRKGIIAERGESPQIARGESWSSALVAGAVYRQIGQVIVCGIGGCVVDRGADFAANQAGVEPGTEQGAVEGGKLFVVERGASGTQAALDDFADQGGFVGLGENLRDGGFDVLVGHTALAKFASDAMASLAAYFGAGAGELERIAFIVDHLFLLEAGQDALGRCGFFGAALEIEAHFKSGMRAAHEGAEGGGVKGFVAREFSGCLTHQRPA